MNFSTTASLRARNSPHRGDCQERASWRRRSHWPTALSTKRRKLDATLCCTVSSRFTGERRLARTFSRTLTLWLESLCDWRSRHSAKWSGYRWRRSGLRERKDGGWYKMAQSGVAVLEDDVEVQANACVDRATVARRASGGVQAG